jgi:hypothetical protein
MVRSSMFHCYFIHCYHTFLKDHTEADCRSPNWWTTQWKLNDQQSPWYNGTRPLRSDLGTTHQAPIRYYTGDRTVHQAPIRYYTGDRMVRRRMVRWNFTKRCSRYGGITWHSYYCERWAGHHCSCNLLHCPATTVVDSVTAYRPIPSHTWEFELLSAVQENNMIYDNVTPL